MNIEVMPWRLTKEEIPQQLRNIVEAMLRHLEKEFRGVAFRTKKGLLNTIISDPRASIANWEDAIAALKQMLEEYPEEEEFIFVWLSTINFSALGIVPATTDLDEIDFSPVAYLPRPTAPDGGGDKAADKASSGTLTDVLQGRRYALRINQKLITPEQYDTIIKWWERLKGLFPDAHFDERIIQNGNDKNGLIEITCTKEVAGGDAISYKEEHRGAVKVTNPQELDSSHTLLKLLNMAFIASNIPNIESAQYTGDAQILLRLINEQYKSIEGRDYLSEEEMVSSLQEAIKKIRYITITLPEAERIHYDKDLELNNAIEVLKAV